MGSTWHSLGQIALGSVQVIYGVKVAAGGGSIGAATNNPTLMHQSGQYGQQQVRDGLSSIWDGLKGLGIG